ncbi:MAG: toll/interleukin-1 receptor domain-containing protein [Aggregatilineales bacterium]
MMGLEIIVGGVLIVGVLFLAYRAYRNINQVGGAIPEPKSVQQPDKKKKESEPDSVDDTPSAGQMTAIDADEATGLPLPSPTVEPEKAATKPDLPLPSETGNPFSGAVIPGGTTESNPVIDVEENISEDELDEFGSITQEVDIINIGDVDQAPPSPVSTAIANFTAYAPREAEAKKRHSLYVYAHTDDLKIQIEADVAKFVSDFGGEIPAGRSAKRAVELIESTPITVIPECDELTFEPATLTKTWHGDWTRYNFDFRASEADVDETLFVRTSIQIAGIEIAHIKSAIDVIAQQPDAPETFSGGDGAVPMMMDAPSDNPLVIAKLNSVTSAPYQRIFISYSRKDGKIARAYKLAQQALGNDVFLDVDNLRAGEDWRAALAHAIDDADIFQLFWSAHSAASQYCAYEWGYALTQKCPENRCVGFIRPVFWDEDRPSPPDELKHLNFTFVPFED